MMDRLFKVDHDGVALGGISIVFAKDEAEATDLVREDMKDRKLGDRIYDVSELKIAHGTIMLWNGDY